MNKTKRLKQYYVLGAAGAFVATVLRVIACILDFNPDTGYFEGKVMINIAAAIIVATVLFAASYLLAADKNASYRASFSSAATYVPTGITSAALVFFVLGLMLIPKSTIPTITDNLRDILCILGALSIGYFITNAFITSAPSPLRGALGLCLILMLALYSAYLYFDATMPLNAPNKIVDQMASLFASLFFLYEIRISLARGKWGAYVAFGIVAAALCAYSSIPSIILHLISGDTISFSIYESILIFSLFIFISARLWLVLSYGEDKENEYITLMKDAIKERRESLIAARISRLNEMAKEKAESAQNAEKTAVAGQISLFDDLADPIETVETPDDSTGDF